MMPREGTLIADRYRLERKVGGGRVAATWLVQDQVTQARCAVKLLHRSMNEHAEALARFSLEDRLGRELTGAYFAERIGSGSWQSIRYIAWRWYDGECLRVLFERTPKQDAQTVNSVVQETCNALTAVHGAGYTHGDLKPENIFFAEGGEKARQLKLLGFGVASRLTQPLLGIQGRRTPGMIVGTPLYLSPDLILGRVPRGGQADLWALAVIVYEALTGRPPFIGDDLGQVLQAILEKRAPKPTSITSNLPATLDQWWGQALEQSFATAGDFATALSRALAPALRSSRTQRSASLPASAEGPGGRGARAVVVSPSAAAHTRPANAGAAPGGARLASAEPAARATVKASSGAPRSTAPRAASTAAAAAAGEALPARANPKASPGGPAARAGASRVAASSASPSATPAPARVSAAEVGAGINRESSAAGARPSPDIASTLLGTGAASPTAGSPAAAPPVAASSAPTPGIPSLAAPSLAAPASAAPASAAPAAGTAQAASPAPVAAPLAGPTAPAGTASAPTKDADATPRAPEAAAKPPAAVQTPRPAGVEPGAPARSARATKLVGAQATSAKAAAPQASAQQTSSKTASPRLRSKDAVGPSPDASAGAVSANAALFRAAVAAAGDSGQAQRSRKLDPEAADSAGTDSAGTDSAGAEEPARRTATGGASHTTPGLGPAAASMIRALQSAAAETAAASIRVVGSGSAAKSAREGSRGAPAGASGASTEATHQGLGQASAARGLRAESEPSFEPLPSPIQDLSSTGTRKTLVGIIPPAQLGAVATRTSNRAAAPSATKRDRTAIEGAPCRSIDVSETDAGADPNAVLRRGSHPTVPFARPRAARRRGSRGSVQDPSSLDPSAHDSPARDTMPRDVLPPDLLPQTVLSHDTVPELGAVLEHRAELSGDPWSFRTMRTSGTLRIVLGNANRLPHLIAGLLVCAAAALVIFVLGRSPVAGTGPIGQTTNSLEPPTASAPHAPLDPTRAATGLAVAGDGNASVQREGNAAPSGAPESHSDPAGRPDPADRSEPALPPGAVPPAAPPATAEATTSIEQQPPKAAAPAPRSPPHAPPVAGAKPKTPERMVPGAPSHPSALAPNAGARAPNLTPPRALSPPASSLVLPPPAAAKGGVPPRAPPGKPGSNSPGTQTASPPRPANGDFDFGI